MYAIIRTGGKQYRVSVGDIFNVEKVPFDEGSVFQVGEVLAFSDGSDLILGSPLLEGVKVSLRVVGQGRGKKLRIFKMRRRKHYRKTLGHRQHYSRVEVQSIEGSDNDT